MQQLVSATLYDRCQLLCEIDVSYFVCCVNKLKEGGGGQGVKHAGSTWHAADEPEWKTQKSQARKLRELCCHYCKRAYHAPSLPGYILPFRLDACKVVYVPRRAARWRIEGRVSLHRRVGGVRRVQGRATQQR